MAEAQTHRINILTVAGIAAVAYVITIIAHEGLGHGGMCLAVGAKPVAMGAYYFDCDTRGLADWTSRAMAAAGNTVNLILAILFSLALKADLSGPGKRGGWTVFLWLMATINAYTWAGYFFFSGVAGIGDWGEGDQAVLHGVANAWLYRVIMAAGGIAIYMWLARRSVNAIGRIVGNQPAAVRRISWTAYATGGLIGLLVGLMNPIGIVIVLISSLASSLGGTSGLMWSVRMLRAEPVDADYDLGFNIIWLVLGVIAAAGFAFALGGTLKFV